tara:strand:- start:2725 stop:3750 length:1026 start_codon:yes stop_codon:yes gene_type:complete
MNNKCKFIEKDIPCNLKYHYGEYCYKHRRDFLIVDDLIARDRFTGKIGDYLKKDLVNYRVNIMGLSNTCGKKEALFSEINEHVTKINKYHEIDVKKEVVLIQSLFRGKRGREMLYVNHCNNDEDFYTFDKLTDVPTKYFYSYVDEGIRWGFDIRSLDKLIQMGFPNPYTTSVVPLNIVNDIKKRIETLKMTPGYEDITETIIRDRGSTIKQKTVDLFSFIEQSGYTCQVDWFGGLSRRRLKDLYKQLEDVWNFRSQLSHAMKCKICPPSADIFKTPMIEVMNYDTKEELQELILHEVTKFTNAESDSDRKLGFMYFLIAFGMVSQPCYLAHVDWLGFMNFQ